MLLSTDDIDGDEISVAWDADTSDGTNGSHPEIGCCDPWT